MTVSVGAPQAILLSFYTMSFVISCFLHGQETTIRCWATALDIIVILALLTWGGFFS